MTLDEFIQEELDRIARFREFWITNAVEKPEHYPPEMGFGEWDEQYLSYER